MRPAAHHGTLEMEGKTRVLVVDNDPQMLCITSRILREADYDVVEAATGKESLEIAAESHPSLILLNVVLPDISGDKVCRIIKSDPSLNDIFIIFITGDKRASRDKSRSLDQGADGYITRPILNDELLSIVKAMDRIKRAETRLRKETEEKKVLLNEIHHRVKNNMQVISSLLNLQSAKIKDKKYADIFKKSRDRIKSMALVHEMLYQSKDFSNFDFNGYVRTVVNYLFRIYGADPERMKLKREIEPVPLAFDHTIPCGLIINELVSNSLKYAFPEADEGEIKIALRSITDHELELTVSDNGIGMPMEIEMGKTESMGLQLIHILAESQLDGTLELIREKGTLVRICFRN